MFGPTYKKGKSNSAGNAKNDIDPGDLPKKYTFSVLVLVQEVRGNHRARNVTGSHLFCSGGAPVGCVGSVGTGGKLQGHGLLS